MITVAIVENDADYAAGVERLLRESGRFACVAVCPSAEEGLARLPALEPNIVLMDIDLPGASGVECVRQLRPLLPRTEILMVTVFQDNDHIFQALTAGATGYLVKPGGGTELLDAIQSLYEGGSPMSAAIARKVVTAFRTTTPPAPPDADLSLREREVLERLAQGRRYKEVAEELGLSFHTVRTHVRNIYKKLHVRSRGQARRAFQGRG